jgi:hypothetical protein
MAGFASLPRWTFLAHGGFPVRGSFVALGDVLVAGLAGFRADVQRRITGMGVGVRFRLRIRLRGLRSRGRRARVLG